MEIQPSEAALPTEMILNWPKMAIKSAKAWEFDQIVSSQELGEEQTGQNCSISLQGGWSIHHRKEWESKKPIKIEETKFPEKASWLKGAVKTHRLCLLSRAFPSRRLPHRRWPSFRSRVVTSDPPGEPRPHQRLQALARRAEAAEEEL